MDCMNKIIDKIIEFLQSFLKSIGLWEPLSELADKYLR